jgi:hypothetical protein
MRKSKNRKQAKREKHKACVQYNKEKKRNRYKKVEKYETWLNLPVDQWSEARKKRNGVEEVKE